MRYRAIETPNFQDLRANFYQEPAQGLNLIQALHKRDTSPFGGQDLDAFMGATLEEPDDSERGEHTRWERHIAVFHCILHRAIYPAPAGFKVKIPRGRALTDQMSAFVQQQGSQQALQVPASDQVSLPEACTWFDQIRAINLGIREAQATARQAAIGLSSSTPGNSWVDPMLEAMLNMLARETSRKQAFGGWRAIQKYRSYHSARRAGDVTTEIIGHLDAGQIVILDLSAGPVEIREVLSERIARQIFERQMGKLNAGEVPQNVVLYVEEAHNLVGKKTELTATWPRIAKEGAKAKIAFVYATQEPSSVHPNILANTENWFVTHLNNDELKTLGKFYDFGDFLTSLKSAQDVGFARIKTLSAPFVIPTQINRFTPAAITAEIQALGLVGGAAKVVEVKQR